LLVVFIPVLELGSIYKWDVYDHEQGL